MNPERASEADGRITQSLDKVELGALENVATMSVTWFCLCTLLIIGFSSLQIQLLLNLYALHVVKCLQDCWRCSDGERG